MGRIRSDCRQGRTGPGRNWLDFGPEDVVEGRRFSAILAKANEALVKVLLHNLCVVHQSHIELGIETEFWPEKPARLASDGPAVLPFALPG